MDREMLLKSYKRQIEQCNEILKHTKDIVTKATTEVQKILMEEFVYNLKSMNGCLLYADPEKSCQALKDRKNEL